MGTVVLGRSSSTTITMALLHLLLLLVPAALAAPTSGESGEDHIHTLKNLDSGESGEDFIHTLKNLDSGEDYVHTLKNYDSSEEYEDFDNLTLSRAGFEERAINTCDCAPVPTSDRIVGGKEVNPKFKLPYQVLVSPCNSNGGCMMCGGTILNKRYVVTAAHCLYNGSNQLTVKGGAKFRVMVGEHDHCKHNEAGGKSYVLASAVHKHPKFDPNVSPDNDIAILKLSKDLTFSDKIKPACLPTSATKDYSGKASTISGWGGTKAYEPLTFVNQPGQCGLKEGIVNILKSTDKKCEDFMGDSTSTTQMCAWAKGTDACQGDSGGPLTVAENGKYVLLGVTSYGSGCATERQVSTQEYKASCPGSRPSSLTGSARLQADLFGLILCHGFCDDNWHDWTRILQIRNYVKI